MGAFKDHIERLDEDRLRGLVAEDMGVLSLREVVEVLRLIRSELEAGEGLRDEEIPDSVWQTVIRGPFTQQLDNLIAEMHTYGEQTQNPVNVRNEFKTEVESLRNTVLERVRPLVRADQVAVQRNLAQLQEALAALSATQQELDKQRTALAKTSATTASSDLAKHYKSQADGHVTTARTFFRAGVVSGVVLAVLTVWSFFWSPPDYTSSQSSEQWLEVTRETVGRLGLLSLAGFALAFCARNYRVNMHLQVLNKRRQNALDTFGLMQAAVTSEDARNVVVGELVRAVFSSEETGYLSGQTERTVIESPGGAGVLQAMTAAARGPGPQS